MTNFEIKKIYRQAKRYAAIYLASTQQVDDFAQYVLLQICSGRKKNTPLYYFLTEYFRLYRCNTRSKKGRAKAEGLNNQSSDVGSGPDIESPYSEMSYLENLSGPEGRFPPKLDDKLKDCLTFRERVIIVLMFEWGFTQVEIANVMGRSAPLINLDKERALENLKRFILEEG